MALPAKTILTVAVTGNLTTIQQNPNLPCTPERVWRAIRAGADADVWREPPAVFDHLSNAEGEPDIVEA